MSQRDKQRREERCLKQTKLCRNWMDKGNCEFGAKCRFAHTLRELRPPQDGWTKTRGHYWEEGMQMPDEAAIKLIEDYAGSWLAAVGCCSSTWLAAAAARCCSSSWGLLLHLPSVGIVDL